MALPSLPNPPDSVSLSRTDLEVLQEISVALEGILWLCEARGNDRTAESVHSLLRSWDSRLALLTERLVTGFDRAEKGPDYFSRNRD